MPKIQVTPFSQIPLKNLTDSLDATSTPIRWRHVLILINKYKYIKLKILIIIFSFEKKNRKMERMTGSHSFGPQATPFPFFYLFN
jgi:hypothetical protein